MPAPKAAAFDRRVARTRKALQHALLALMLKKGYDAITVEEICAEADVGRSTFYAHFTGKDDLKRCGLEDHLRKMLLERQHQAKEGAASNERFRFALPFLEHARDHLDLYRALVSKGGAPTTIKMIRQIVTEEVRRELAEAAKEKSPDALPREVVAQFIVGAFMSLLTWWLDGGAKLPAQRVDAIFRRLATEGVEQGRSR
jgi:AcrR family transcriptional regulator